MREYSATTQIKASPEKVWKILTDGSAYPNWSQSVTKVDGTIASGGKITVHSKISPNRAFPVNVSEFVVNKQMAWESGMPLGLFKGKRTFTLVPKNGGTEFSMREVFTGPMLALIGRSIPDLTENFQEFAADLKRRAEA